MPITTDTFELAMEEWSIWKRWEASYYKGLATLEMSPALPEDRGRYEGLQRVLVDKLSISQERSFRKRGQFRERKDGSWNGLGLKPLEVNWVDID